MKNHNQVTGHVNSEMLDELEALAEKKKCSKSEIIRKAVNYILDLEKYKNNDMYYLLVHKEDTDEKVINKFNNLKENIALESRIKRNY